MVEDKFTFSGETITHIQHLYEYIREQKEPKEEWVIEHGGGRHDCAVYDDEGRRILMVGIVGKKGVTTLTFPGPLSGKAYFREWREI
jgi:hypothetical protein